MTSRGRGYGASDWDAREDYNSNHELSQYGDEEIVSYDHARLYVTNLPTGLSNQGMKEVFSKYGTLEECYVSKDPKKRYALFKYGTPGEARVTLAKLNKTEPLFLNINIAKKSKAINQDRQNGYNERNNERPRRDREEAASIGSRSRRSRAPDEQTNGDSVKEKVEDELGLDRNLHMELESLKLEQLKIKKEQLKIKKEQLKIKEEQLKIKEEELVCKHRLLLLQSDKKGGASTAQTSGSNRCILPDGRIVVRAAEKTSRTTMTGRGKRSESLGKGGAKRPRIVLRDNIQVEPSSPSTTPSSSALSFESAQFHTSTPNSIGRKHHQPLNVSLPATAPATPPNYMVEELVKESEIKLGPAVTEQALAPPKYEVRPGLGEKFQAKTVRNIIVSSMQEQLQGRQYRADQVLNWTKMIANGIKQTVLELDMKSYHNDGGNFKCRKGHFVIPLHLGKCMEDLDELHIVPDLKTRRATQLSKTAMKLFKRAEEARAKGDEEHSYVCYMKYVMYIMYISENKDYLENKSYFNNMLGAEKTYRALDAAMKLKISLIDRYEKQKAKENKGE